MQIVLCGSLCNRHDVCFTMHPVLQVFSVNWACILSLRLAEHISYLFNRHIYAIFNEQGSYFAAVQRPTTILIELLEHIVDDIVRFNLRSSAIVMLMRILSSSCFEPRLVILCLESKFALLAIFQNLLRIRTKSTTFYDTDALTFWLNNAASHKCCRLLILCFTHYFGRVLQSLINLHLFS